MPGKETQTVTGEVMTPADVPEAVVAYFGALNAEDFARLKQLWAPDAELRAVGSRPRTGRDDIMAYFRPIFEPWPVHSDTPTRFIVAGNTVVAEVSFTGRSASGKDVTFDAIDVFDLVGSSIRKLTTWYDLSWVRRQI